MNLTIFQKGMILTAIPLVCQLTFVVVFVMVVQEDSLALWIFLAGTSTIFLVALLVSLTFCSH